MGGRGEICGGDLHRIKITLGTLSSHQCIIICYSPSKTMHVTPYNEWLYNICINYYYNEAAFVRVYINRHSCISLI